MLTERGPDEDRVTAARAVIDGYLTKPFHIKELLAQVEALGRREADAPRA